MATNTVLIEPAPPYSPSDEDRKFIAEVEEAKDRWKVYRRPHERVWFVNGAMFRGEQWVRWSAVDQRLVISPVATHKKRLVINRLQPKVRARIAKFLKNRAKPEVLPASTELHDKLDARLTTKALDYLWRKLRLEEAYKEALLWASLTGHGYWWFHWDPTTVGRVQFEDPLTKQKSVGEGLIGDVTVEVGSPFEVLVSDPGISYIGNQPKIMRIKMRDVRDVRARYAKTGKFVDAETTDNDLFSGARQLSHLSVIAGGAQGSAQEVSESSSGQPTMVMVMEMFCRPSPEYPKGQYLVVANGVLLRKEEELPYGLWDQRNPYPCVDFPDIAQPGQYWITTICEQMVEPQREYNLHRSRLAEHNALMTHPKLIHAVQHQIPPGSWTSEAGEVLAYVAQPNIPPPFAWTPPPINADTWKTLDLLVKEIEDISHIFPEAEGRVGEATSGFQTNLLQEATDAVHAPDVRTHELCIEEAAFKARRLMKLNYTVPRLLTVAGRNMHAEVFEFSQARIDEHADIIVQAGSALPTYKAAKIQALLELHQAGLFGDPTNPETNRKVLSLLEMADFDSAYQDARQDEEDADIENNDFAEARQVDPPEFFHNHEVHYKIHANQLKSAEVKSWQPEQRMGLIAHLILHVKFMNPQSAIMLAQQYNMPDLVADLMPTQGGLLAGGPAPAPGMDPAMAGAPAGAPMPGAQEMTAGSGASGSNQFNPEFGIGAQGVQPPG